VLREAENLVRAGVKELLIVSQDTSAYGVDVRYRTDFWNGRPLKTHLTSLAAALGELGAWVRLHYVYPYPHVDEVVPLMAEGKVFPYLDVPLQHASPRVLKAMKRPANTGDTLGRVRRWRDICPDLTLRSTFIVGFPGETEDDFERLLEFLAEAELDRVGCFSYSPVEGAAANQLAESGAGGGQAGTAGPVDGIAGNDQRRAVAPQDRSQTPDRAGGYHRRRRNGYRPLQRRCTGDRWGCLYRRRRGTADRRFCRGPSLPRCGSA
jgi:hypothetical protein